MRQKQSKPVRSVVSSAPASPLAKTMMDGFGFGVGASVARNVVDHVASSLSNSGGATTTTTTTTTTRTCEDVWENYSKCIQSSSTECDTILKDLHVCIKK